MLRPRMTDKPSRNGVQEMIRKSVLLTITLAMLALPTLCPAQQEEASVDSVIEAARADIRTERNAIIGAAMDFSDKDAAAFWPVYRRYEYERSTLEDRRAAVVKEYAEKYSTMTDAVAKQMTEQILDCGSRESALRKKYFKEFSKVLPAMTVAKFFQLEHRVDLLMDMRVESALPPIAAPQDVAQQQNAQQQNAHQQNAQQQK
jgi:hypothetical protein